MFSLVDENRTSRQFKKESRTYSDFLLVISGAADGAAALGSLHEALEGLQTAAVEHVAAAQQHLRASVEPLHADGAVRVQPRRHSPLDALPFVGLKGLHGRRGGGHEATRLGHCERHLLGTCQEIAARVANRSAVWVRGVTTVALPRRRWSR